MQIKLNKRMKYAGDIHKALVEQVGWDPYKATEFLANIPDVPRGKWIRSAISGTLVCSACYEIPSPQKETARCPACDALMDL